MVDFSFIHAADLHIGAPFRNISRADSRIVDSLLNSTFQAFDALVTLAIDKRVDFLLLSGDLFDSHDGNLKALLHFRTGMKRLRQKGIRVFIVHGNHDPLDEVSDVLDLPENCYVFPAGNRKWQIHERRGRQIAAIFGISFAGRSVKENLAARVPAGPENIFKIAMLHCTVGSQPGHYPYAPCALSDLTVCRNGGGGVDYWALGHVHRAKILSRRPFAVYPGVLQSRSFREQGEKGAFLVEVSGDRAVRLNFHALDNARWVELEIDAASARSPGRLMDEAWRQIDAACEAAGSRGLVLRLAIRGRSVLSRVLAARDTLPGMLEELRDGVSGRSPFVWIESIRNFCRSPVDLDARKKASDIVALILQEADAIRNHPERRAMAERQLSVLFGSRNFRNNCPGAAPEDLSPLLEEAEFLLLDSLEG